LKRAPCCLERVAEGRPAPGMATRRRRAEGRSRAVWSSACGWLLVLGAAGSRVARLAGSRRRACVWWRTGHLVSGRPPRPLPSSRRKGCARLKPPPSFPHAGPPCSSAQPSWQAGIHPRQPSPAPRTFCHTSSLHLLMLSSLPACPASCILARSAQFCVTSASRISARSSPHPPCFDAETPALSRCEPASATPPPLEPRAERSSLRTRARTRARSGERAAFETRGSRGRGLSELFSQVARSALARSPQLRPVPRPRSKLSARCRHPWGRSLPRSVLGLSAS